MVEPGTASPETCARVASRIRARTSRDRRKRRVVLVKVEAMPRHLAALERLGLLDVGDRSKDGICRAVTRFMEAAGHVAALGDALWPAGGTDDG